MKIVRDYREVAVRITDERLAHILEHPEMVGLEQEMEATLVRPERVVQSLADPEARLYYRLLRETPVGDKYLCVVVKDRVADTFLLTAYLTDKVKRGDTIWPQSA